MPSTSRAPFLREPERGAAFFRGAFAAFFRLEGALSLLLFPPEPVEELLEPFPFFAMVFFVAGGVC